jgi:hypothetical protein
MKREIHILKASGESEAFSSEKLKKSLRRAGASESRANSIIRQIEDWLYDGVTSRKIYDKAFSLLRKNLPEKAAEEGEPRFSAAARYKLKNAMMELGPTGHPFEHLVGEVFYKMGYSVEVGQVLQGSCVTHEMDVIATKGNTQILVECKFHFSQNNNASVQVPLYVRARVDDIIKYRKNLPEYKDFNFIGCVVTNTRFTLDAAAYGECSGLKMLSWDYPGGNGLREIIDREKIFPVTVLTRLSMADKQRLMERGIVVCRQIRDTPSELDFLELEETKLRRVLMEVNELVK